MEAAPPTGAKDVSNSQPAAVEDVEEDLVERGELRRPVEEHVLVLEARDLVDAANLDVGRLQLAARDEGDQAQVGEQRAE